MAAGSDVATVCLTDAIATAVPAVAASHGACEEEAEDCAHGGVLLPDVEESCDRCRFPPFPLVLAVSSSAELGRSPLGGIDPFLVLPLDVPLGVPWAQGPGREGGPRAT